MGRIFGRGGSRRRTVTISALAAGVLVIAMATASGASPIGWVWHHEHHDRRPPVTLPHRPEPRGDHSDHCSDDHGRDCTTGTTGAHSGTTVAPTPITPAPTTTVAPTPTTSAPTVTTDAPTTTVDAPTTTTIMASTPCPANEILFGGVCVPLP